MTAGLDARACLGLVLVVSGIRALPQALVTFMEVAMMGMAPWQSMGLVLPFFVATLQVAAGCTFAFNRPRAGLAFLVGYVAVSITFALYSVIEFGELGQVAIVAISETIGIPVVVAIAIALGRPAGSAPRSEAGALLVVLAISSLVGHGVYVVTRARSLDGTGGAAAFGEVLMVGIWVAVAILQLLAGLQLRRGDPTAERTLKAYVIASIVGEALMLGLPFLVGFAFRGDRVEWFFAIRVVTAIDGVALPLLFWAFVRHHRVPMQEPRVPTTPAWSALVLVPYLAARPLVIDDALTPQFSAELAIVVAAGFGVQAVATALATRASLQDKLSAGRHALVATVVALIVTTMVIVLQQIDSDRHRLTTGPLISLVVTTAVMAWLHRTAHAPVPRAIAKRT